MHARVAALVAASRRTLARWPLIRVVAIAASALLVARLVYGHSQSLEQARASWGDTVAVAVASAAYAPGDVVETHTVEMPVALLIDSAVDTVPESATARQHIARGEVIVASDITTRAGPTALAPEQTVIVAVADNVFDRSSLGSRVAVYAEGITLTADATITAIDELHTYVAVPAESAALVAQAASARTASIGLLVD